MYFIEYFFIIHEFLLDQLIQLRSFKWLEKIFKNFKRYLDNITAEAINKILFNDAKSRPLARPSLKTGKTTFQNIFLKFYCLLSKTDE